MKDRLVAAGYALGWLLVRRLPLPVVWRIFRTGADLAARRQGRGTRRLAANLARVAAATAAGPSREAPEAGDGRGGQPPGGGDAALTVAALRSYARYWLEVFRLPSVPAAVVAARTDLLGRDALMAALAEGRGVVLALPHMGNWDHAGVWLIAQGVPFTTVAERLRPEAVFDRFVAFREGIGMEVVPLTGGAAPPFDILADRLRAGGALCLLADRDLTERGVAVSFFGATATMPAGPALLALRTGAALMPVTLWWDDPTPPSPMTCRIHDRLVLPTAGSEAEQVSALTQLLADAFAEDIARHPQDWHMLQRLWRDDLDPARRPGAPGAGGDRG